MAVKKNTRDLADYIEIAAGLIIFFYAAPIATYFNLASVGYVQFFGVITTIWGGIELLR